MFKTKKTLTKEKQQKENIFKAKRENVSKWKRNELKKGKKIKETSQEANKQKDLEERMEMIGERESDSESENNDDHHDSTFDEEIEVTDNTETMELQYRMQTEMNTDNKEMRELLPIKTKQGLISRETDVLLKKKKTEREQPNVADNDIEEEIFTPDLEKDEDIDSDNDILESLDKIIKAPVEMSEDIIELSTAELLAERQETIESLKFKIGVLCSGILEKPEEKIKNLTTIMHMIDEKNKEGHVNFFPIRKMAILSLMEIFRDIIPEYRVGVVDLETQKGKQTLAVICKALFNLPFPF